MKRRAGHDDEEEEIVDHGDDACGKEIVQGVHVGGDAGDEAADRIAVEIAHGQALDVRENFAAHVVHDLLADALHDADLGVLREKIGDEDDEKDQADPLDAAPRLAFGNEMFERGSEVAVDGLPEEPGWR